ncbi:MAG: PH domain-containing protein [Candidatus Sungiibacteriota bacterium]|uniref:PH domain-containing protein n=1 Tax=Candidatus Sungiibacteriota bacterium TaxID=2750080 RepID=A0A7T5RIT8_9BACT|nr:MAG: PH domain-containing protein [Candidatus Sungbacteria bacterium]
MLRLNEDEKVVLVIHKHWFIIARQVLVIIILIMLAPVALTFLPLITGGLDPTLVETSTNFFLSIYVMVLLLLLFLLWMDHYLDMWIITTERIVDVEQRGLFSREISEIPLSSVQDITIEIRGLIETFLKFGKLRIQTAGEREFTIKDAPALYEAKDIILKYARGRRQEQGSQI